MTGALKRFKQGVSTMIAVKQVQLSLAGAITAA